MAKSVKLTLMYPRNYGSDSTKDFISANNEIQRFCAEFPEMKLIEVKDSPKLPTVNFTLKYPIKIRDYIDLYLKQHDMERRISHG